jgi:catabolite regulation protein CreA
VTTTTTVAVPLIFFSLWLGALIWMLASFEQSPAHAGQPIQIQDVIEVDGAHVRRIYDPTVGVACYVMRWPASAAPDLACVKVTTVETGK